MKPIDSEKPIDSDGGVGGRHEPGVITKAGRIVGMLVVFFSP